MLAAGRRDLNPVLMTLLCCPLEVIATKKSNREGVERASSPAGMKLSRGMAGVDRAASSFRIEKVERAAPFGRYPPSGVPGHEDDGNRSPEQCFKGIGGVDEDRLCRFRRQAGVRL